MNMNPGIKHEGNRFIKVINGYESHLEYETINDEAAVFYHTYVPEALRGQGHAMDIIREGLDWAISQNLKIIPTCSAVRTFILRHPEYQVHLK
jgi:predicted GNAT family acetyltransferase